MKCIIIHLTPILCTAHKSSTLESLQVLQRKNNFLVKLMKFSVFLRGKKYSSYPTRVLVFGEGPASNKAIDGARKDFGYDRRRRHAQ